MGLTSGPFSVLPGSAATYIDPNANGNVPSAAVQILNASPFVLNVLAAGQSFSIAPLVAQTVPLAQDGAGIVVTPQTGAATVAPIVGAYLTLEWLLVGQTPSQADGPLSSSQGGATEVTAAPIPVGSQDYGVLANGDFIELNFGAIPVDCSSVLLVNTRSSVFPGTALIVQVSEALQPTTGLQSIPAESGPGCPMGYLIDAGDCVILPFQSAAARPAQLSVWCYALPQGPFGQGGSIVAYALPLPWELPPHRSDGRPMPIGMFAASGTSATGSFTLVPIPAPAKPQRVLLYAVTLSTTSPGLAAITATINGVSQNLLYVQNGQALTLTWPAGLLCDFDTPVDVFWGSGSAYATAQYDAVV